MSESSITEYVTTNIRLSKQDLRMLKQEALAQEKSVNAIVRELVRHHVSGEPTQQKTISRKHSIWDLPKRARRTGDPHLAMKVDDIVYGK